MEEWKEVKGYEGLYEVSNQGNVRSLDRIVNSRWGMVSPRKGIMLKQMIEPNKEYLKVSLSKGGVINSVYIHRLVAEAFIPNPCNHNYVNHIDENPANNNYSNLEWCTNEYNISYGLSRYKRSSWVRGYDKNDRLVVELPLVSQGDKYGFNRRKISKVIHHQPDSTYKGLKWKMLDKEEKELLVRKYIDDGVIPSVYIADDWDEDIFSTRT